MYRETEQESGLGYRLEGEQVHCLDLDEDAPLPENLAKGQKSYDAFKGEAE